MLNPLGVPLVVWLANLLGLVPLVYLVVLRRRAVRPVAGWWWLGAGFAVSSAADFTSLALGSWNTWFLLLIYPVSQTTLIVGRLVTPAQAVAVLVGMGLVTLVAIAVERVTQPDLLLYSVECVTVVTTVAVRSALPPRLRLALVVYFGLGLVAWLAHVPTLDVPTWYAFQFTRLAGLALVCWAMSRGDDPLVLQLVRNR